MIDLHSHILPGIDDGAKTPQEGKELLNQMSAQGVSTVVATPHFFPASVALEDFLSKRSWALKELSALLDAGFPVRILPGAEVLYFGGIGRVEAIKDLTLAGSRYLLLELLGVRKIDRKVIADITALKENFNIMPIIAHVERYCKYKGYKNLLSLIESGGALCQINATYTESKAETRAVKELLGRGLIDFVASDCHHPVKRPVKLDSAFSALRAVSPSETERIIKKSQNIESEILSL